MMYIYNPYFLGGWDVIPITREYKWTHLVEQRLCIFSLHGFEIKYPILGSLRY